MTIWEDVLNILFPERCINCGKSGNALCAICERKIIVNPHALSETTATLFDYRNPLVKKAIWGLKYQRRRALGVYFGNALYREFFVPLARGNGKKVPDDIVLIPIPASKKALSMRGYNHATLIARAIAETAKSDGMHLSVRTDILYKKREVPQQAGTKGRTKRQQNVAQVFGIRRAEAIEGQTVILIDDVITTGATMNEARQALKTANPKRLLALAAAH